MKKKLFADHQLLQKGVLAVLYGLLFLGFSLLYYLSPYKLIGFGSLLRKGMLAYGALLLGLTVVGQIRKKSVVNLSLAKRGLVGLSIAFLICVLFYTGIIVCSLQVKSPEDVSVKTDFFSDKDVMILVPHEDDDVNLMGGLIEQYTGQGSRVSVVFATNGDFHGLAPTRYREAFEVLTDLGVEQENIIFLGFGDKWQPHQQGDVTVNHIYNSLEPDELWTSANNRTACYGTSYQPCYLEQEYTRNNYLGSIKSVIEERKPQIIYCVDHDEHVDHRAVDLFFEEAMGQILAQNTQYRPVVYRGFCYGTAWKANDDFTDSINILSTKKPDAETWEMTGTGYSWENRMRVPVSKENLNRMLSKNSVYQSFNTYASQEAYYHTSMVLNGDKVFWERRVDSLLYNARFSAGDETVTIWNDFKLKDSGDISLKEAPMDGVRGAEQIHVVLPQPVEMDTIGFYDHPNPEINVLGGYIVFDDGDKVAFGPLNPGGDVTYVSFPEKKTEGFTIYVTETEGEGAGFAEIEAYQGDSFETRRPQYLMALDEDDNFVYDYWLQSGDSVKFTLYSYPSAELDWNDVDVFFQGDTACSYRIENGELLITCPEGCKALVTVRLDESISTTFTVENPGKAVVTGTKVLQLFHKQFFYSMESLQARLAKWSGIYRRESVK